MTELTVVVPSRGRPEQASELCEAFAKTCTGSTKLVFVVDDDDPDVLRYKAYVDGACAHVFTAASRNMVEALNWAARVNSGTFAVGFMGDDHRPRTVGWDTSYIDTLHELGTGVVFGDDLLQSEKLPTQCALTSDIIRTLGYMAPPELHHMYVDNFWRDLGEAAGCIRYLPDVVVEHLHPAAGKAEWDDGYRRVNNPTRYAADGAAYGTYRMNGSLDADVAKVRALREGVTR